MVSTWFQHVHELIPKNSWSTIFSATLSHNVLFFPVIYLKNDQNFVARYFFFLFPFQPTTASDTVRQKKKSF